MSQAADVNLARGVILALVRISGEENGIGASK
jgi:hypothetical protein